MKSRADVAQLVEHVHGKDGVAGSSPAIGSRIKSKPFLLDLARAALCAARLCD